MNIQIQDNPEDTPQMMVYSFIHQWVKVQSSHHQVRSVVYIVIGPVFTVVLVTRGSTNPHWGPNSRI